MRSCLSAQIRFLFFKGPGPLKKILKSAEMYSIWRPIDWYHSHPPPLSLDSTFKWGNFTWHIKRAGCLAVVLDSERLFSRSFTGVTQEYLRGTCGPASVADPRHFGGSGTGSADPSLWLMNPDPSVFVINLQDANKKLIFCEVFLLITFWRYIYIIFQR